MLVAGCQDISVLSRISRTDQNGLGQMGLDTLRFVIGGWNVQTPHPGEGGGWDQYMFKNPLLKHLLGDCEAEEVKRLSKLTSRKMASTPYSVHVTRRQWADSCCGCSAKVTCRTLIRQIISACCVSARSVCRLFSTLLGHLVGLLLTWRVLFCAGGLVKLDCESWQGGTDKDFHVPAKAESLVGGSRQTAHVHDLGRQTLQHIGVLPLWVLQCIYMGCDTGGG